MRTTGWLTLCVVLMLGVGITAQVATQAVGTSMLAVAVGTAVATVGALGILIILKRGSDAPAHFPPPRVGTFGGLLMGLALGMTASAAAGFLVSMGADVQPIDGFWRAITPERILGMVNPAVLEEAAMRGGVVHILDARFGYLAGLTGGSLPFGVLHLAGALFGQPVSFAHVIGTAAAGLFLSLIYLRWGLLGAMACHWIWNVLAGPWTVALGLEGRGGTIAFEGAWQTTVVLLALSFLVHVVPSSDWLARRTGVESGAGGATGPQGAT